jgi:hypothetical protein
MTEKEMYYLILSNDDELREFARGLKMIKDNQNCLEFNPVIDTEDKIKKINPLEVNSMDMETKVIQLTDNIDDLMKSYHGAIDIINQKFALYNNLLNKIERK